MQFIQFFSLFAFTLAAPTPALTAETKAAIGGVLILSGGVVAASTAGAAIGTSLVLNRHKKKDDNLKLQ